MAQPESENRYRIGDPAEFTRNMMQVGQQSQRLLADFVKRQTAKGSGGAGPMDPLNLTGTFTALLKSMAANPAVMMEAQFQLWRDYMGLWEQHRAPHDGRHLQARRGAGRRATSASRTRTGKRTRSSTSSSRAIC